MFNKRKKLQNSTRPEKLRELELYYLQYLVEDPVDGTSFDNAVLDAIEDLKNIYGFGLIEGQQ